MPMGGQHEEMGTPYRVGRRFVMVLVLYSKSLPLARVSNYPGVFAARWVQYRGIAPSAGIVLAFNIWLVLTSLWNGLRWVLSSF